MSLGPLFVLGWSLLPRESPVWSMPELWQLALLILALPLLEEWVFRGLLLGGLRRHGWNRRLLPAVTQANLLAAIAFGLAHWPLLGLGWALPMVLPGLLFGYFFERHAGIGVPSLLHGWYNATALLLPPLLLG